MCGILSLVLQIDEVDSIHLATERLMGSMGDTPEMVRQARILALVSVHSLIYSGNVNAKLDENTVNVNVNVEKEGHPPCKETEWWGVFVVICLGQGADLPMALLIPLPLTVTCSRKSRLVLI